MLPFYSMGKELLDGEVQGRFTKNKKGAFLVFLSFCYELILVHRVLRVGLGSN